MRKQEIIEYGLKLKNTYSEAPFPKDPESIVLKHRENKKWFGLIMPVKGKCYVNVKTDPSYSDLLRKTYDYIIPAYHMNKEHWNTIILQENCDRSLVEELIKQSYELTK